MAKNAIFKLIHLPESATDITVAIRVTKEQSGKITFNESGKPLIQKTGSLTYTANSAELSGKSFDFNIVCTDVNPEHNMLMVTVELSGVSNNSPWTLSKEVEANGTYQFFGTIEFYL